MNKIIPNTLATLFLTACSVSASVTVIESTPEKLTFRWEIGKIDTASLSDSSGGVFSSISFSDGNITLGNAGESAIPGQSVFAGVPASGTLRIRFSPGATTTLSLSHPLKVRPANQLPDKFRFADQWISQPSYSRFRDLRAAQFVIRPFSSVKNSRSVRILTSAECTVEFPVPAPSISSGARTAAGDYERMLRKLLLNYDVAAAWRDQGSTARAASQRKTACEDAVFADDPGMRRLKFKIGDGHNYMNEVTTKENGVLKITGAQILRLLKPSTPVYIADIVLYASWKGELPEVPPAADSIPDGLIRIPLLCADNGTAALLDSSDYFLAFVTGLSDWGYDTAGHDFIFNIDKYDDDRTYWLAIKKGACGKSMPVFVQPSPASTTDDYFVNRALFRQPNYRPATSIECKAVEHDEAGFAWQRLSVQNTSFQYPLDLPGLDATAPGSVKFRLFSPSNASITATIGGSALCTECSAGTGYPVAAWGDRTLRLTYNISGNCDIWQLDLVTASYRTALRTAAAPVNMTVFSVNDTAVRNYKLTATGSGRVTILRIPIDERGVSLVDTLSGSGELVWSDTGGIGVRYAVCNDAGMITLPDNDFSAPARTDLRGTQNSADYLVIAHPDFLEEAQRLAAHKKNTGFSACRAVSLADVYDNFSGGNVDPAAIRNFLAHARRYWTKGNAPDYVLLMGGGSYDYKSIKTSEKTFIPPFLHGGECIEDFFGFTDPDSSSRLSLAVGRITCRTRPEAVAAVDKIIASEDPAQADKGSWRNSILFIADDDMQLNTYDGIGHYRSSEKTISVVEALRPAMDIRKIYLFDYPWSGSMEKPGASRAIINAINNGVGYVNWYGHGSEDVLADEHVVTLADMPQFYNVNQYPLFTSFSCAVGKFDRPDNLSLGEAFVLQPRAGMIATFAAVREAYASDNEDLGKNLFRTLFDTAENQTLGMAIIEAKAHSVGSSKEIYALLGDPSLRINDPSRRVVLRVDTGGAGLDTLMALQQIRITGSVIDKQGIIDRAFDGSVQLGIYNAPSQTGRKDGGDDQTIVYTTSGRPVFSGKTVVRNGVFEQTALLPPSLSFDQTGPKLNAYAWSETATGSGSVALIFHGTRPAAAGGRDTTGPQISLRQIYDADNMGAVPISSLATLTSSLPLKFEIVLSDPAGVNVVGDGPDEGLTMEIPGYVSRRNINQTFQFDAGDYRAGAAVQTIGENFLKPGRYDLILSAQDLLGNVSRAKIAIEITDETALSLNHVFNAPNPFRMGESTRFFFFPSTQTQNARAQFVIKIYSLGGKLLRVIRNAGNGEAWNGRDQKEYQLPPNIYLYQVTADYTLQQKLVKSRIQKLVIHPPR